MLILSAFQIKQGNTFRLLFVAAAIFASLHFFILNAYTAAVLVIINGSRWLVSLFYKSSRFIYIYIFIIGIATMLTYQGILSLFPMVAGTLGTIAAFQKNESNTRKILLVPSLLWLIHNTILLTPMGIVSELSFSLSNIIGYNRNKSSLQ